MFLLIAACALSAADAQDWRVTGGEPGHLRYSALDQINTRNVAQLRVAWTYHTGDLVLLKTWPVLDPLRSHPRFQALLRRMNFPQ